MKPKIRQLRLAQGLKQRELAERIGMDCPRLSRVERGLGQLYARDLMRIAQALHLMDHPLSEFFEPNGDTVSGTST
jgi:transcriptional regulator with XRE-family HTH domain